MSASASDSPVENGNGAKAAAVPKRITNAQTVCNERNEKGKLCNGHLKQLRTAGEAAEVHLRGDDVLFKCQTCGTFYMGPPLGHVRDPRKQHRFVEAELTALLQAAGGTLPVIKKDERGVYVMVETAGEHGHGAKPAPAKSAATPVATKASAPEPAKAAAVTTPAPAQPAAPKGEAQPDRTLMKRYTYSGVVDTGPLPGETFAQKVERLKAVAAGAKRRADEGGAPEHSPAPVAAPQVEAPAIAVESAIPVAEVAEKPSPAPAAVAGSAPDRSLMRRSTYCGVVDTGPVPGESFAQKVERLRAVAAAAKQRAEGG
jgi:hypothetical protein